MRDRACLVAGMAALWLCLKSVPLAVSSEMRHGTLEGNPLGGLLLYGLYAVVLVLCLVGTGRLRRSGTVAVAAALCGVASLALRALEVPGLAALVAAALLMAVFIACFLFFWGVSLARCSSSESVRLLVLSYMCAEGVRFALSWCDASWMRLAFPLVALAMFVVLRPRPQQGGIRGKASAASLPRGMLTACFLLLVLWSVMLGVLPPNGEGDLTPVDRSWSYGLSFCLISAMALYFHFCLRSGGIDERAFFVPFAAIVVLYLFALTAMQAFPGHEFVLFKRVFVAMAQCLEVLGLAALVMSVSKRHLSVVVPLALYATLLNAGLWTVVAGVLQASFAADSAPLGEVGVLVLSFATADICIGSLLGWSLAQGRRASRVVPGDGASLCAAVAKRAGLSGRESEVLELLYRGHSAKRIAEELYVSENTVRSHTNNIYKKLDVHSKQELMQVIEAHQ